MEFDIVKIITSFWENSPITPILEFVVAVSAVVPLTIQVWRLVRYKADALRFLETTGSFREHGETIKHFRKRMDKYTNPTFTPVLPSTTHFSNKINSTSVKYKDLWKHIISRDNNRKVLIIYAEAGMGKSRLLRHITYKLILDARKRIRKIHGIRYFPLVVNGVYYSEFRRKESIHDLVREIIEAREHETEPVDYIILDGFDECREFFTGVSTNDVLNNLLHLLNDERVSEGIRRIIISSRVDMFEHEKSAIASVYTTVEDKGSFINEPVDLVKIDDFNTEQIIKRYKTIHELDRSSKSPLTVKKLRKYLAAKSNPILRVPLFIEHADVLFDNTNGNFVESYEEGLQKIINVRLEKEYTIYIGNKYKIYSPDKKRYAAEMMTVLGTAAFIMYKKKSLFLLADEYNDIPCKYKMQKERLLMVREAENPLDHFSFQHKLFYEYFLIYHIVNNETVMSFTNRRKLLGLCHDADEQPMNFNPSFAKSLYIYILYNERKEIIEKNIMLFELNNKKYHITPFYFKKLLDAECITVVDNPTLDIDRIIFLLPFAPSFFYRNFQLNNIEKITRYLDEHFFQINKDALPDCTGAERLGRLDVLDTTIGKINVSQFEYFSKIDEIRITIEDPCELDALMNITTCDNIKLLVRTKSALLPKLVRNVIDANLEQPRFSFFNTITMKTLVDVSSFFQSGSSEPLFDMFLFLENVYFIELYYSTCMNDDTYDVWYMITAMCERNPKVFYHFTRKLYQKRLEAYGKDHPFTLNALIIHNNLSGIRYILAGNHSYDIDDECSYAMMNVDLQDMHIYLQEVILLYRTMRLKIEGRYDEAWEILVSVYRRISEIEGSDKYLFTVNIGLIDTLVMQNRLDEAFNLCNSTLHNFMHISDHPIYSLARHYRGIIYLDRGDSEEAVKDLSIAAEVNNFLAQNLLGDCYYDEEDYENAVKYYQKAAELGFAPAQNSLGDCCYFGTGIEQNYAKAVEWYQMATEQGFVYAQNRLGDCYYYGKGVEQNYAKAVEWYRMAAELGYVHAQNNLGDCYYFGDGVEQDYKKAEEWFQKATEHGYNEEQYNWRKFK